MTTGLLVDGWGRQVKRLWLSGVDVPLEVLGDEDCACPVMRKTIYVDFPFV